MLNLQNGRKVVGVGVLSIGFGVLLMLQPVIGGLAIIWIIGTYELIFGVLLVMLSFRLRNNDISAQRPMAQAAR